MSPEGLLWLSSKSPPAWERHLVWGVPAVVFAIIVIGLAWWTQDGGPSRPIVAVSDVPPAITVRPPRPRVDSPAPFPLAARRRAVAIRVWPKCSAATAATSPPLLGQRCGSAISAVGSDEDLLAIMESAPQRSIIVLTDDGPYDLGDVPENAAANARLSRREFTLKADDGVRPVIRLAPEGRFTACRAARST